MLAVLRDSLNIGPGGCENQQIHGSLLVKDLIQESDGNLAYPWDSPLTPPPHPSPRKPLLYRFFQVFKVRYYHSNLLNKPKALKLKWGFIRDLHCYLRGAFCLFVNRREKQSLERYLKEVPTVEEYQKLNKTISLVNRCKRAC